MLDDVTVKSQTQLIYCHSKHQFFLIVLIIFYNTTKKKKNQLFLLSHSSNNPKTEFSFLANKRESRTYNEEELAIGRWKR